MKTIETCPQCDQPQGNPAMHLLLYGHCWRQCEKGDQMIAVGLPAGDGSTAPKIVQVAGFTDDGVLVRMRMGGFQGSSRFHRKARKVPAECLVREAAMRERQTGRIGPL